MIVLGIESSCDETGVALYCESRGIIGEALFSQVELHAEFGGVVPEIASRDHIRRLLPLIKKVMTEAKISPVQIDALAYTAGPGLMGALFVGACTAKSLAYSWNKPAIPVHHMEGHLLAPLLESHRPDLPFVALLVSGGHTQLVKVERIGSYEVLGATLDDAAGEAFDKVSKMLGLGYPGGPQIAKYAENGSPNFDFPRPMVDRPGLDFSFSGLKTAVLNKIYLERKKSESNQTDVQLTPQLSSQLSPQQTADIAAAFQKAVVETLVIKCRRALKQTGYNALVLAGGVSANQLLRSEMKHRLSDGQVKVFYPRPEWCTDNGAMIAFAGYHNFIKNWRSVVHEKKNLSIKVFPRWDL